MINPLCTKCYSKNIQYSKSTWHNKFIMECSDCGHMLDVVEQNYSPEPSTYEN